MSQVSQLQRILDVLECPFSAETSNRINDVLFQVKLISWFEDRKIRQLDIGQRSMLKFDNGVTMTEETWANTMNEYLRTIGCPIVWKVRSPESSSISLGNLEALIWMARHSVSLDCNDLDALSHVEMNAASLSSALEGLKSLLAPTDSVTNDVELVRKATQNVKFMTLSTKSDVLQTTSFSSLSKSLTVGDDGPATATDPVQEITAAYRMLYVSDFRELQNDVNKLIVLAQDCTANPKCNTSMGKVGR